MTDEEIFDLWESEPTTHSEKADVVAFARTIEQATARKCAEIMQSHIKAMKQHTDQAGNITGADFYDLEIEALEDAQQAICAAFEIEG